MSSVRVDRRGTCSIGSKGVAAPASAGNRHRCQVRSRGATWRSARAAQGRGAGARAPAAAWLPGPAATCAVPMAASTGTHIGSKAHSKGSNKPIVRLNMNAACDTESIFFNEFHFSELRLSK